VTRTHVKEDIKVTGGDDSVIVLPDVIELREQEAQARRRAFDASKVGLYLLLGVCLLNSIDALLTKLLISNGIAMEGNPVVASIGLMPKVILVPLAAEVIYLLKPRALWVPFLALLAVVAYTSITFFLTV
jgi:hypothetical protein